MNISAEKQDSLSNLLAVKLSCVLGSQVVSFISIHKSLFQLMTSLVLPSFSPHACSFLNVHHHEGLIWDALLLLSQQNNRKPYFFLSLSSYAPHSFFNIWQRFTSRKLLCEFLFCVHTVTLYSIFGCFANQADISPIWKLIHSNSREHSPPSLMHSRDFLRISACIQQEIFWFKNPKKRKSAVLALIQ